MRKLNYYIPGSILILLAFVLLVVPQILVALVAASIMLFGIGALYFGHLMSKSMSKLRTMEKTLHDDMLVSNQLWVPSDYVQ